MSKFYYIKRNDNITGPFSEIQLKNMFVKNILDNNTLISDDRIKWSTFSSVFVPKEPETVYMELPVKPVVEEPATVYLELPPNKKEIIQEEEEITEEDVPEEEENAEPEDDVMPDVIPDPVYTTFSMIWNAPAYIRNMHYMYSLEESRSSAMKFTLSVIALSVVLEIFVCGMLFFFADRNLCIAGITSILLTAVMTILILLLENLCIASIVKYEKMLNHFQLFMQINLFAFSAFVCGMPLAGLAAANTAVSPALKAVCIAYAALTGTACMINMGAGIVHVSKKFFKMHNFSSIFAAILNIVLWFLMLLTGCKITEFLKNTLFEK